MDTLSGNFTLHIDGPANVPYTIQVSTNLAAWTSTYTNATGGPMDWPDPCGTCPESVSGL